VVSCKLSIYQEFWLAHTLFIHYYDHQKTLFTLRTLRS